jgi:5-methylcytosine-specific restriction endonuclease McrA
MYPKATHCGKCGVELPPDRTWRGARCAACRSVYHREHYQTNKAKIAKQTKEYRQQHPEKQRAYARKWREGNPERAREIWTSYRERNREKMRAATRAWYRKYPDRVAALKARFRANRPNYHKEHYAKNRERYTEQGRAYYAANQDRVKQRHQQYYFNNRDRHRVYWMRRRARKAGATVGKVDFNLILERDGWICHICGGLIAREDLSFDHIIPLAKGGLHTNENLSPAHNNCNKGKGARLVVSVAPPRIRRRE